jgi:pimeloyl-ACP methyl ester carboxylesterase
MNMTIEWKSQADGTGRYAEVNGLNLYDEIHGSGSPVVLLHGGLGSGEMFGPTLPALAAKHQIVLPD